MKVTGFYIMAYALSRHATRLEPAEYAEYEVEGDSLGEAAQEIGELMDPEYGRPADSIDATFYFEDGTSVTIDNIDGSLGRRWDIEDLADVVAEAAKVAA